MGMQIIGWKSKGEPWAQYDWKRKLELLSRINKKKVDERRHLDTSQQNCRYQRQRHL